MIQQRTTMSTSAVTEDTEEDEVKFVSEGPLRPVVEYIDLLSDGDDDAGACTLEDQVDRQKAQAMSTLDRLARQVAAEKQERAEKCKAFKEKMISQQAHGRRELAFNHCSSEDSRDAKRCVDSWLKMPGLKPGVINTGGTGWRRRSAPVSSLRSSPQTCPVINCGRVYDSVPLLEGHLKRFDHSPCDPTIMLKGSPDPVYACVACGRHFNTKAFWRVHVNSKLSNPDAAGHVSTQTCQLIVCFACPACYLLFNLKDDCLQHMAAKSHFTQSISLYEVTSTAVPIPVPRYVKNRLIALCKDVPFSVKCTVCSKVLTSHMDAKAHFSVHCRHGCAIAIADQSVAQIMKQLTVLGHCSSCPKIFFCQEQTVEHEKETLHDVKMISCVEQALLVYSNYKEIRHSLKSSTTHSTKRVSATKASSRSDNGETSDYSPAKRQRISSSPSQTKSTSASNLAWFCECGLRFLEEDKASKHLLAANQIFHKCAVCGKLMGEFSIARLHMSRFHGGAHLSNFLFHCRQCSVEMPRQEDILSHVGVCHHGHTYYEEKEDTTLDDLDGSSEKPSTSIKSTATGPNPHVPKSEERWMCRMCEDTFDSEAEVHRHCSDLSSHSFQRFICGHCPQKFFKESTLRRHCANEHNNQLVIHYFCGLCDSMLYDSEQEFLQHYTGLHSRDYYRFSKMENGSPVVPESSVEAATSNSFPQFCMCMGSQKSKKETKFTFTNCMKQLASEGKCNYVCHRCAATTSSYAEMKTHLYLNHEALGKDKSFDVACLLCPERHKDVPSFHLHYHANHCSLEPCESSRTSGPSRSSEDKTPKAKFLNAEEISPKTNAEEFQNVKRAFASSPEVPTEDLNCPQDDDADEHMKLALALSAEEARKPAEFDKDMEEALKRSLVDF